MNIICSFITRPIRDLAKEIGESEELTNILVSAWQTEHGNPEAIPTAAQLRARNKEKDKEYYLAIPTYSQAEYKSGGSFVQNSNGQIVLSIIPTQLKKSNPSAFDEIKKKYLDNFIHLFDRGGLKELIDNNLTRAYEFILWREQYLIAHGSRDTQTIRKAEAEAVRKLSVKYFRGNMPNQQGGTYEVSTAGDKRFSAFNATFAPNTIVLGHDVSGMTIENAYQRIFKQSGKNQHPANGSYVHVNSWLGAFESGNPVFSTSPELAVLPEELFSKLRSMAFGDYQFTKQDYEDFSYYMAYLPLWQEWAKQNPQLMAELAEKSRGKTLTDQYANTKVSQARALTDILNKQKPKARSYSQPQLESPMPTGEKMQQYTNGYWSRDEVSSDTETLYIFTDNTDRDSGRREIPSDSWYAQRYGEGHHYPTMTSAVIRGLDNARPISTQRWYHVGAKGKAGRWTDADIEEFKKVIDAEIEDIKRAWDTGKYKRIVFPGNNGLFATNEEESISAITETRVPALYNYLKQKYAELYDYVENGKIRGSSEKTDLIGSREQKATINTLRNYYSWQREHLTKSPNFKEDHKYLYDGNPVDYSVTQLREILWPVNISGDHSYSTAIGTAVDSVVRDFFEGKIDPKDKTYPNLTTQRRDSVIADCERLKAELNRRWPDCKIITTEFTLAGKITFNGKEVSVAGTMDMLVVDKQGNLHILDMKAKKDQTIDSFNNRRDYEFQLNAYRQLLEKLMPTLAGKVVSLDLIWFDQSYPSQGTKVTYITNKDTDEVTVQFPDKSTVPMSEYTEWTTPHLQEDIDKSIVPLLQDDVLQDVKPIYIQPVEQGPVTPMPQQGEGVKPTINNTQSDEVPKVGVENFNIQKKNSRADLIKTFTIQQREYRVEMIAWDIHDEISKRLRKKRKALAKELANEVSTNGGNTQRAQELYRQVQLLNGDERTARRAIIDEVGIVNILDSVKAKYREMADLSNERAHELLGDNADYVRDQYQKVLDNFLPLLQEVSIKLETLEPFRFAFKMQTVQEGNTEKEVEGGDISQDSDDDNKSKNFEDNEDGEGVTGNDGLSFRAKFVEPHDTLTKEVKELLRKVFRERLDGRGFEVDDLGNFRKVPERYAYAALLSELAPIIDDDDFIVKNADGTYDYPALYKLAKIPKYKWISQIVRELKKNPRLASKFFRGFRKDAVNYWGHRYNPETLKYETFPLNKLTVKDATMSALERNYHNMLLQDPDSIYDNSGNLNKENAKKGLDLLNSIQLSHYIEADDIPQIAATLTKVLKMMGFSEDTIDVMRCFDLTDEGKPGPAAYHNLRKLMDDMTSVLDTIHKGRRTKKDVLKEGVDYVNYFSTSYFRSGGLSTIAETVGVSSELNLVQMFRVGDSDFPTYTAPDYSTKLVKILQSEERRDKYIEDNFKVDPWYYNETDGWMFEWGRLIAGDETEGKSDEELSEYTGKTSGIRSRLAIIDIPVMRSNNGENVFYKDWTGSMIRKGFITQYFAAGYDPNYPIQFAWYSFPIFSDSEMARFIRFVRYVDYYGWDKELQDTRKITFEEQLIPLFRKVVLQELKRRARVKRRYAAGVTPIANYDSVGEKEGRGEQICFFPKLNNKEFLDKCDELLDANKLEGEGGLYEFIDNELWSTIEAECVEFLGNIDIKEMQNHLKQQGVIDEDTEEATIHALREYFWNQYFATTQIIELTTGDLAYYKNDIDFQKRFKEVYAAGEKLNTNSQYGKKMERSIKLKDKIMTSMGYTNIKMALNKAREEGRLLDMDVDAILDKFKNINATDAQAFRSLRSMRSLLDMLGEWNDDMERAINNFENGTWDMRDFNLVWQTIKPYLFTNVTKPDGLGGRMRVPIQHKDSEALLLTMYQLVAASTAGSGVLRAVNEFMDKNDIDLVIFESGVKVGCQGPIELGFNQKKLDRWVELHPEEFNKLDATVSKKKPKTLFEIFKEGNDNLLDSGEIDQREYNRRMEYIEPSYEDVMNHLEAVTKDADGNLREDIVDTLPYSDYCVQQPTPEHLKDVAEATFGSQFRELILSDLPKDFKIKVQGVELDRQGTINLYQALIVENLLDGFEKASSKFKNIETLRQYLISQIQGNTKYNRDLLDALEIVEIDDPREPGKKMKVFNIPMHIPSVKMKVQQLVYAAFKNAVTKQKIRGGNAIIVSSFGLTDKLQVLRDSKTGAVKGIECYLPATSRRFYEPFLKEVTENGITYYKLDIEAMPDDMRRAIGYRIPTEDKYSMIPLIIKGFLPEQNGSQIMLPADITTISGCDFDIDKLYLMLPSFGVARYNMKNARERFAEIKKSEPAFGEILQKTGSSERSLFANIDLNEELSEEDPIEFQEWFEENKKDFKYDKPQVYKLRYNAEKGPQGNDKPRRDNMIIDIAFAILTHPSTSEKLQNPGSFDNVKSMARVATIVNDPHLLSYYQGGMSASKTAEKILKEARKGYKKLDGFVQDNSIPRSVCSIETFIFNHEQNMAGASLIGMYANNTTAQAKNQLISMEMAKPTIINGREIRSLTAAYTRLDKNTTLRISKMCAEFSAASVDNGKDPNLAALQQNRKTANIMGTMLRAGLTIEEAGLFFAHPEVRKYLALLGDNVIMWKEQVNQLIQTIAQGPYNKLLTEQSLEAINLTSEMLLENAIKNPQLIAGETEETLTQEKIDDLTIKAKILYTFTRFVEVADIIKNVTTSTRADSPNGAIAITPEGAEIQRRRIDIIHIMAKKLDCPVVGLDNVIRNGVLSLDMTKAQMREALLNTQQPMLQGFYSLGIDLAQDVIGKYMMESSPRMKEFTTFLHNNASNGIVPEATLKNAYLDIFKYFLADTDMFAGPNRDQFEVKRKYYVEKYPQEFLKVLKENPDLESIPLIKKIVVRGGQILFDKSAGIDTQTAETFIRDMDMLMFDESNPVGQQLAMDLFAYTYYKHGLRFGPNNLTRFFSSNFLANIPEFINRSRDMMFDREQKDFWDNFRDQFMATYGGGFVQRMRFNQGKDGFSGGDDGLEYFTTSEGRAQNYNTEEGPKDYVVVSTQMGAQMVNILYKLDEVYPGVVRYKRVLLLDSQEKYFDPNQTVEEIWKTQEEKRKKIKEQQKKLKEMQDAYLKKIKEEKERQEAQSRRMQANPLDATMPTVTQDEIVAPPMSDEDISKITGDPADSMSYEDVPRDLDEGGESMTYEEHSRWMEMAAEDEERGSIPDPSGLNAFEEDSSMLDEQMCIE